MRVAQDSRAEDGKVQAVLIDLCSPLISLTASWFIEMGPRVRQGYGSKHLAPSPRTEGHTELRSIDYSVDPRSHNPLHQPLPAH